MQKRARQRQVPHRPHKPSSMALGARWPALSEQVRRARNVLDWMSRGVTLHATDAYFVRFREDGTAERLSDAEAESAWGHLWSTRTASERG